MNPAINPQAWRDSVVAYIRSQAQPVDKFGHQPRLYALACEIAADIASDDQASDDQASDDQACDDDVLFAAAWMHDLGVFAGHRPADPAQLAAWNHVPYTVARSSELLLQWGFPAEKIPAVEQAILTHQAKDDAVLAEAVVLRDADILEQLGAIGALRTIVKVGRDTRYATYSDVIPVLDRALQELPGKLRLARSRELAKGRVETLRNLLQAIREEAADRLF